MKKIALALFAVLAVSTLGWACDGCAAHAKVTEASADDAGGCPHAKKAAAKAGCGGGCSSAKASTCGSVMAEKTGCCGGCSAAKSATCASARGDVKLATYSGRVLCTHCNLKKTDSCSTVFQLEGEKDTLAVCPQSKDIKGLRTAGDHGNKVLEVKGHICEDEEGHKHLMVASWSDGKPST